MGAVPLASGMLSGSGQHGPLTRPVVHAAERVTCGVIPYSLGWRDSTVSQPLQSVVHSDTSAPPARTRKRSVARVRRGDSPADRSWRALAECLRYGSPTTHLPAMNLCEVLAQLPKADRGILLLRAVEDLAMHEADATAGIDPAEADQRYALALGRLREAWQASPAARAFWKPFLLPLAH